ncbi:MAG: hypothetical protein LBI37_00005, partial [Puniceicoccales bacterium]|nr:hypothetical protein [Puniceicoccales bacterium]
MKSIKIVVICSGNTCRSPMAEALLTKALEQETGAFEVVGAGLSSTGGGAGANTILAMKKIDMDLSKYKSKKLTQRIINESVVVFCMAKEHLNSLKKLFSNVPSHCYLWRGFLGGLDEDVVDPFGCDLETYITVRNSISEAIPSIVK